MLLLSQARAISINKVLRVQQAVHSSKIYSAASLPSAICVVVFPLHCLSKLPLCYLPLTFPSSCHVCGVRSVQSEQMHFSGSAAFTIRVSTGNYHLKTPAHNISINVAFLCHLGAQCHQ